MRCHLPLPMIIPLVMLLSRPSFIGSFQEKSPSSCRIRISVTAHRLPRLSLKARRGPRRRSVQRFTSKRTNPGQRENNFGSLARERTIDRSEIMFGSRPASNGSASSSTSGVSSSSSSSSGSSPMTFHDKQHYVCILCNK